MPHLISNRPRRYSKPMAVRLPHGDWELFNFVAYLIGGVFLGSLLFLPYYTEYEYEGIIGAWLFVFGSCLYTAVAFHDLYEITQTLEKEWHEEHINPQHHVSAWSWIEWTVSKIHSVAAAMFMIGYENLVVGTWLYIIGSLFYGVGAVINMAQIYLLRSHMMIQLQMFIAVQFLVGSILFGCGSVIYLFDIEDDEHKDLFVGGFCFTGGAMFIGIPIKECKKYFGAAIKAKKDEEEGLLKQKTEGYASTVTSSDVTN